MNIMKSPSNFIILITLLFCWSIETSHCGVLRKKQHIDDEYDEFDVYDENYDKTIYEEGDYVDYNIDYYGETDGIEGETTEINLDTHFSCGGTGNLILIELLCNGNLDCGDGSDEVPENCLEYNITPATSTTAAPVASTTTAESEDLVRENGSESQCAADEIVCDVTMCLPREFVCDGMADCVDESDEQNCSRDEPETDYQDNGVEYSLYDDDGNDGSSQLTVPNLIEVEETTNENIRSSAPSMDTFNEDYYDDEIYPKHIPSIYQVIIHKSETKPIVEIETPTYNIVKPIKQVPVLFVEPTQASQPMSKLYEYQPDDNQAFEVVYRYDDYDNAEEETVPVFPAPTESSYQAEANVPEPFTMNFDNINPPTDLHLQESHDAVISNEIPVLPSEEDLKIEQFMNDIIRNQENDLLLPEIDDYETSPGDRKHKGLSMNSNNHINNQPSSDSMLLSSLLSEISQSYQNPNKRMKTNERKKKKVEKQRKRVRGLIGQLLHHVGKLIEVDDNNSLIDNINIGFNVGLSNDKSETSKLKLTFDINL